jgi:hypothetical protein
MLDLGNGSRVLQVLPLQATADVTPQASTYLAMLPH